jgi:hypothetical protein
MEDYAFNPIKNYRTDKRDYIGVDPEAKKVVKLTGTSFNDPWAKVQELPKTKEECIEQGIAPFHAMYIEKAWKRFSEA